MIGELFSMALCAVLQDAKNRIELLKDYEVERGALSSDAVEEVSRGGSRRSSTGLDSGRGDHSRRSPRSGGQHLEPRAPDLEARTPGRRGKGEPGSGNSPRQPSGHWPREGHPGCGSARSGEGLARAAGSLSASSRSGGSTEATATVRRLLRVGGLCLGDAAGNLRPVNRAIAFDERQVRSDHQIGVPSKSVTGTASALPDGSPNSHDRTAEDST